MKTTFLNEGQALQKLKHYCAYQERCHSEMREKLIRLGVSRAHRDSIIATLIEENYLNEERFAIQYAGGKFRINHWGKNKIRHSLLAKQISEYCINKALASIEEKVYYDKLKLLADKKYNTLKDEQLLVRKKKIIEYLLQKGYEKDLVLQALHELNRIT